MTVLYGAWLGVSASFVFCGLFQLVLAEWRHQPGSAAWRREWLAAQAAIAWGAGMALLGAWLYRP